MIQAETALLTAVRDAIRVATGLRNDQVRIEIDEQAPAVAGNVFVAVMPDGIRPGETHSTNQGASDAVYSVAVMVAVRETKPRDRKRDHSFGLTAQLEVYLQEILSAVDFEYDVTNAANDILEDTYGESDGFVYPLTFAGIDNRPRERGGELFAASREATEAAIVRVIRFGSARRIATRTLTSVSSSGA